MVFDDHIAREYDRRNCPDQLSGLIGNIVCLVNNLGGKAVTVSLIKGNLFVIDLQLNLPFDNKAVLFAFMLIEGVTSPGENGAKVAMPMKKSPPTELDSSSSVSPNVSTASP